MRPPGAVLASAFVAGVTSGDLGMALKAGLISAVTAGAFKAVGNFTASGSLGNVAGHAAVGCLSAVASGGRCGSGALSAGIPAAGTPFISQAFPNARTDAGDMFGGTAASAVLGGLGSVAGGGKFENGAVSGLGRPQRPRSRMPASQAILAKGQIYRAPARNRVIWTRQWECLTSRICRNVEDDDGMMRAGWTGDIAGAHAPSSAVNSRRRICGPSGPAQCALRNQAAPVTCIQTQAESHMKS